MYLLNDKKKIAEYSFCNLNQPANFKTVTLKCILFFINSEKHDLNAISGCSNEIG